jgi:Ser/Thr protein kinase RdoA (MazF antagonist)
MNGIFSPVVMEDIEMITEHVARKGLCTPRPIRTIDGKFIVQRDTYWWRALTFISGRTFEHFQSPEQAQSAGALLGRFHAALIDCAWTPKHELPDFHKTQNILQKLNRAREEHKKTEKFLAAAPLIDEVFARTEELPVFDALPIRLIHGDLKASNVLFELAGESARAFIDLDTLMRGDITMDVGDALRSWSMIGGEDAITPRFDADIGANALAGYLSEAHFLTETERSLLLSGIPRITLELTARFLIDALEESYFTHDKNRYVSLAAQNMARAQNQLLLLQDFCSKRRLLETL